MKKSYSQWGQDKWVSKLFRKKQNGFFIELGAGDGVNLSNTLMLEEDYGWTGILIEPTRIFEKLKENRPSCFLENSCVASEKKKVNLFEVYDRGQTGDNLFLSIVRDDLDIQNGKAVNTKWGVFQCAYQKEAIPLHDILLKFNAPKVIDYFSLDVEGYEYEVLKNFPFKEYIFLCLGVECPSNILKELLVKNDYIFVCKLIGDAMYVHKSIGRHLLFRILFIEFLVKLFLFAKKIIRPILKPIRNFIKISIDVPISNSRS